MPAYTKRSKMHSKFAKKKVAFSLIFVDKC